MTIASSGVPKAPTQSLQTIAEWGTECLGAVIALDSASDERSESLPSTEGQRQLATWLQRHFAALGLQGTLDSCANLLVRIPPTPGREATPAVALMVHMDTARGTRAVPALTLVPRWDGSPLRYPKNERLTVDVATYPHLSEFLGDDLLHGPGDFPVGFDDKLGMAELMTLARLLHENPSLPHGELFLVFRPDEEIGRMAAVEGLAKELSRRGVRFGYTVDGIAPFEVNVENFNAARARVRIPGHPLRLPAGLSRRVTLQLLGVNTHGATAKAEGYRNATVIFARALAACPAAVPLALRTDLLLECNAELDLVVVAATEAGLDAAEAEAVAAFEAQVAPLASRGGALRVLGRGPVPAGATDAAVTLKRHLLSFLEGGPVPLLSEESDGFEGYTNPHRVTGEEGVLVLDYRLRDFTEEGLRAREAHVRTVAGKQDLQVTFEQQYVNMGPALAGHPELTTWAVTAATALGISAKQRPIRGGTGVDPFLTRGIPVANLGTGYFAPESEKELTSRQNLARHAAWLVCLVQVIGAP